MVSNERDKLHIFKFDHFAELFSSVSQVTKDKLTIIRPCISVTHHWIFDRIFRNYLLTLIRPDRLIIGEIWIVPVNGRHWRRLLINEATEDLFTICSHTNSHGNKAGALLFVHKLCWEHRIRRRRALNFLFFSFSGYHIAFQLILFFVLYNCLNHVLTVTSLVNICPFETRTLDRLHLDVAKFQFVMLYYSYSALFCHMILWDDCKLV